MPVALAVGDTFGIVQGSVNADANLYFEVYGNNDFLFSSETVSTQNNLFALTITIPGSLSQVQLIPVVNGEKLSSVSLSSGETKQLTIDLTVVEQPTPEQESSPSKVSSSSTSSFDFQPLENEQMIEDISQGAIDEYVDEITIMPIPEIKEEKPVQKEIGESTSLVVRETPQVIQEKSFSKKLNDFFLQPIVLLSIAMIACLLLVAVVLKERRDKYL